MEGSPDPFFPHPITKEKKNGLPHKTKQCQSLIECYTQIWKWRMVCWTNCNCYYTSSSNQMISSWKWLEQFDFLVRMNWLLKVSAACIGQPHSRLVLFSASKSLTLWLLSRLSVYKVTLKGKLSALEDSKYSSRASYLPCITNDYNRNSHYNNNYVSLRYNQTSNLV